jgi:hypothetical protein
VIIGQWLSHDVTSDDTPRGKIHRTGNLNATFPWRQISSIPDHLHAAGLRFLHNLQYVTWGLNLRVDAHTMSEQDIATALTSSVKPSRLARSSGTRLQLGVTYHDFHHVPSYLVSSSALDGVNIECTITVSFTHHHRCSPSLHLQRNILSTSRRAICHHRRPDGSPENPP